MCQMKDLCYNHKKPKKIVLTQNSKIFAGITLYCLALSYKSIHSKLIIALVINSKHYKISNRR